MGFLSNQKKGTEWDFDGDLMKLHGIWWDFNGDLMGFHQPQMLFFWDFNGDLILGIWKKRRYIEKDTPNWKKPQKSSCRWIILKKIEEWIFIIWMGIAFSIFVEMTTRYIQLEKINGIDE